MSIRLGLIITVWAIITSCGAGKPSPTPRYYLLGLTPPEQMAVNRSHDSTPVSVEITNVRIPEYIARPQIVTRISPSELELAEFDRWAQPLSNQLAQVVADQLTLMLSDRGIVVSAFSRHSRPSYQIEIDVSRLDGSLKNELTLIARWVVIEQKNTSSRPQVRRENLVKLNEKVADGGYPALVEAHNQVIKRFCEDVAAGIRKLL